MIAAQDDGSPPPEVARGDPSRTRGPVPRTRCRCGGGGTGLPAQRPVLPVPGIRPYALPLGSGSHICLIADAPQPTGALDDGETCPWQDRLGRCTAREARPLGCRIYFCDPSYQSVAPELSEAFLGRLKELVRFHGWSWNYAPLHRHLRRAQAEGRLPDSVTLATLPVEDDPSEVTASSDLGIRFFLTLTQAANTFEPLAGRHGPTTPSWRLST